MANATFFLLLFVLAGWLYRIRRSLSELKQAPSLRLGEPAIRQGKVSILIPVKNEEKTIAACVQPLLAQLHEEDELLVINNCSDDRTESILKDLGAVKIGFEDSQENSREKFKYFNTPPTPEGWTGKNFALFLGMEHVTGDWLLFTDADTRHEPGSLNAAVSFAEKQSLVLLTLLPRCLAHGFWEEVIQPCAMGYMGLWFPLRKVNDPRSRVYFGNGQYLLIRSEHYRKIGGHENVKEAFLEDFALMKKTKEAEARAMCAFGMEIYGTRMYHSFGAIWRGWRRIYLHAFEQRPAQLLKSSLSVFFYSFFPFAVLIVLLLHFSFSLLLLCILILGLTVATAFKTYAIVKARKRYVLLHPLAAFVFTLILLDALQMAFFKRRTHWR